MTRRTIIVFFLSLFMFAGLVSGVFANSIEKALTLPTVKGKGPVATTVPVHPKAQSTPVTKPTTPAMQTVTPTQAVTMQMQPPTTLAQDTFQRTDQPLWGTASDGQKWDGDANIQQVFTISNTTGQISNGQGPFNALLGPPTTDSEVIIKGSINSFAAAGANLGAVLRWTTINNWYKAHIDGTRLFVLKDAGDTPVTLKSVPFAAQENTSYTLRFRIVGTTLFAKVWPSASPEPARWMITTNDNTFARGQSGIRVLLKPPTVITITSVLVTTATNGM